MKFRYASSRSSSEQFEKKVHPIRVQGGHICFFSIGNKNTKLVEDGKCLLFVKLSQMPFIGFGCDVENVLAILS